MYIRLICTSLLFFASLFSQTATPPAEPPITPFSLEEPQTPLPPDETSSRFLSEFLYMLLMLGLLVGALLFATRFLKRMTEARYDQANVTSSIKVLERRQISPKTTLYLLEIGEKSFLIAETPTHVTRIDQVEGPDKEVLQT